MIEGFATTEGTAKFRARFASLDGAAHFREAAAPTGPLFTVSSIGLGTYLGEPDAATDASYVLAVRAALKSGINLLDTAANYRHQRSERNIGSALLELVASGELNRDEVVVCTKAGYLAFDDTVPANPREYLMHEYIDSGVIDRTELAADMHCMAPAFLEDQIERSRRNLRLRTIDVFYVHNPESQLCEVPLEKVYERLRDAFGRLEELVSEGKIGYYGIASWSCFRVPQGDRDFIGIEECANLAREAGGAAHHFRFLQLPFNLAMPEAYAAAFQPCGHKMRPALETARRHGLSVVGSASLYQGKLTRRLPCNLTEKFGLQTDAQCALQFARSAPSMLAALVGMSNPAHVQENMETAVHRPMAAEDWESLFTECGKGQ